MENKIANLFQVQELEQRLEMSAAMQSWTLKIGGKGTTKSDGSWSYESSWEASYTIGGKK